jgi:hypothetical protein
MAYVRRYVKWHTGELFLHHYIVPTYSVFVMNFWLKWHSLALHPPGSPNVALCDFFYFSETQVVIEEEEI